MTSDDSGSAGGECIEVAWVKSSAIHVRDSKDTTRGSFTVSPAAWSSLLFTVVGNHLAQNPNPRSTPEL
ncbi:DUF397 domain-containing protein [Streptomyces jeddahensis]|uniref:DUF397 domain-containing protein n=1 Tax=Streptomyces jeddahensis TaxID=1716141 RepID=A0A177HIW6_9ACTN|nr:DUF397 domain-containing protein [Streptomyces jeddahensis]OAH10569.1 hypothetical protein STSP_60970 [Streptomyces jeddahensis]